MPRELFIIRKYLKRPELPSFLSPRTISWQLSLFNNVNNESEIGINSSNDPKQAIVEAALLQSMTLDEIMDEWNEKWTSAQESNGVTPEEYDYIAAISK